MKFLTSSDTMASELSAYGATTAEYIAASETRTERKFLTKISGNLPTTEGEPEVWVRIGASQKTML